MTRKDIVLVSFTAVLAVVYLIFFTGTFHKPILRIVMAPPRLMAAAAHQAVFPPAFDLIYKQKLTSVKVVPLHGGKFNNATLPAWHLVSTSNSVPTKAVVYGIHIPGMIPARSNAEPQALQAGIKYRLLVQAGRLKGHLDFRPVAVEQPADAVSTGPPPF